MIGSVLGRVTASLAALSVTLAAYAAPASRWGNDGHKIVAQIAYDNLTPSAKTKVDALLDGDTLPGVAMWADEVKTRQGFTHTKPWHYADMNEDEDEFSLSRDCPDEGCVVQAIIDVQTTLANANATKSDRQEAIKFLVHFVGDVHQPLHAGRKDDKGGNSINVKFFNSSKNLHAVWDTALIQRTGKSWTMLAGELETKITPASKQAWQQVTDPAQWATESHRAAEDHAYRTPSGSQIHSGEALGQDYYDDGIEVVEEQLMKAGVRLAASLNAIFDPPPVPGGGAGGPSGNGGVPAVNQVVFVGSRKSSVYHLPTCKDVERISPDNYVEYSAAPPGKHLHQGCPR